MYESEADEKHLDFIAATPATVSIGVIRLFGFLILVLCSCPVPELSLPRPIGVEPRGGGRVHIGPVAFLKEDTSLLQCLITPARSLKKDIWRVVTY